MIKISNKFKIFVRKPLLVGLSALFLLSLAPREASSQNKEALAFKLKEIHDHALTASKCYDWLTHLSTNIGGRLSGSPAAAAGVEYTRQIMESLEMDSVWLQPCMVPHWERGEKEIVRIVQSSMGSVDLKCLALGNSVGTGSKGLTAEVIEVHSLDTLDKLGAAAIKGKIVFFNRPMDNRQLRTFNAYGGAVDQRGYGPSKASKYGAVAAIVRSMTTRLDDIPHTGVTINDPDVKAIPALAISTNDAEELSALLKREKTKLYIRNTSRNLEEKLSYNVIGEIRGSEYPDEIILVGGHLDSWDVGGGAHDDGAGCVHSLEVIHLLQLMDYKPKRTIRCVMFMNEENGLAGGRAYAEESNKRKEFHLAAIESDAGGFVPRGFSFDGAEASFTPKFKSVIAWLPLLAPYGLELKKGGSGADISPLKSQGGLLAGLRPDSQRYFDYHHTAIDNIDAVNKRELELGAAAMTSLVYLIDQFGLE